MATIAAFGGRRYAWAFAGRGHAQASRAGRPFSSVAGRGHAQAFAGGSHAQE